MCQVTYKSPLGLKRHKCKGSPPIAKPTTRSRAKDAVSTVAKKRARVTKGDDAEVARAAVEADPNQTHLCKANGVCVRHDHKDTTASTSSSSTEVEYDPI